MPAVDGLVRYVHADRDGVATAQYSTAVRAVLVPGALARASSSASEIAQRAKAITGRPTSFGASQSGTYGEVGWIVLYDSIDEVQAASEALADDAGFGKLLDDKASTWIAGASSQVISRKWPEQRHRLAASPHVRFCVRISTDP